MAVRDAALEALKIMNKHKGSFLTGGEVGGSAASLLPPNEARAALAIELGRLSAAAAGEGGGKTLSAVELEIFGGRFPRIEMWGTELRTIVEKLVTDTGRRVTDYDKVWGDSFGGVGGPTAQQQVEKELMQNRGAVDVGEL